MMRINIHKVPLSKHHNFAIVKLANLYLSTP